MPRAFLIKAKKEKKKEDEQGTQSVQQTAHFSNGVVTGELNLSAFDVA